MQFNKVIGQQQVKRHLIKTVQEGRISHAQLFLGPEGCGKLALAIAYAQHILCQNPQPEDSCGTCPACLQSSKLAHPDLHFSFPYNTTAEIKDKPVSSHFMHYWRDAVSGNPYMNLFGWLKFIGIENKQGIIPARDSEEVIKKLGLKSYEGGYKVLIVWMPEKWHTSAANKLLKLIEEPPAKTLILIVAEDAEPILPTILSRTQLVKVPALKQEEIKKGLLERFEGIEASEAEKIAFLAEGSFNEAQRLIVEQEDAAASHQSFVEWMRLCYTANIRGLVDWVDVFSKAGREAQKNMLNYGLRMFRECVLHNYQAQELVHATDGEGQFIKSFAPFIHEDNLEGFVEEFEKAIAHIERNANPKILFFDLSLQLTILLRKKPESTPSSTT